MGTQDGNKTEKTLLTPELAADWPLRLLQCCTFSLSLCCWVASIPSGSVKKLKTLCWLDLLHFVPLIFLIQPLFPLYLFFLSGVCAGCFISKIFYENSLWKFSRFPVLFLSLASCLIHSALQRLMWLSLETDQTKYLRPNRAYSCFWTQHVWWDYKCLEERRPTLAVIIRNIHQQPRYVPATCNLVTYNPISASVEKCCMGAAGTYCINIVAAMFFRPLWAPCPSKKPAPLCLREGLRLTPVCPKWNLASGRTRYTNSAIHSQLSLLGRHAKIHTYTWLGMYSQRTKHTNNARVLRHMRTSTHTQTNSLLTMPSWTVILTVQGCQRRTKRRSVRSRNAAVKTSFPLCAMQGKWWQHKTVTTVKAFSRRPLEELKRKNPKHRLTSLPIWRCRILNVQRESGIICAQKHTHIKSL